ncbi:DUF2785 domain-containing protein [Ferroacidibacillus organovorans]|uniref:DUF2785 domain-containing protein n=1 Tax=Ferroacidibacillus organovorans TaxID=1765683 RepID=A0A853KA29_9BACL|nr:DUF2785 domain-containing protein [Ferroacidibacillus organovorans]KYP79818.1 hypothetical protein AYJ22_13460 [Ferroacidibacillus organovorans]OAG92859.1 hypothetical protein AYW79_13035 [Ferroacidibacillus organovorans]
MTREPGQMQNKMFLREIIESDQLPSGENAGQFARELMQNLVSSDPELRDDLTYRLMGMLSVGGHLGFSDHEELLGMSTDAEHLFHGIGESGTDTVFMRSFSALMIPLLLVHGEYAHRFSTSVVEEVANRLLSYAITERDWRGYVPDKGWAHSVAHTADALMACGTHPAATKELGDSILQGIKHLAMVPYPLGYLEDDRLAFAAFSIIHHNKTESANIQRWLDSFQLVTDQDNDGDETLCGANAEHFLRSLYFRFLHADRMNTWLERVVEALARFDIYHLDCLPGS